MSIAEALVLGVVQGLTEFLPISSTAHLRIVPALSGWEDPGAAFSAALQLGTLGAVLLFFWQDIYRLLQVGLGGLFQPRLRADPHFMLAWGIACGNLPVVVFGLGFREAIEGSLRSLYLIAFMLVAVAGVMHWAATRKGRGERLGFWQMQGVGLCQALALIPGVSRSGITLVGGLYFGLSPAAAARFSFLLGIPAILGSGLYQLPAVEGVLELPFLLGVSSAFFSGYLSIGWLLRWVGQRGVGVFVGYRLVLGGVVAALAGLEWVV